MAAPNTHTERHGRHRSFRCRTALREPHRDRGVTAQRRFRRARASRPFARLDAPYCPVRGWREPEASVTHTASGSPGLPEPLSRAATRIALARSASSRAAALRIAAACFRSTGSATSLPRQRAVNQDHRISIALTGPNHSDQAQKVRGRAMRLPAWRASWCWPSCSEDGDDPSSAESAAPVATAAASPGTEPTAATAAPTTETEPTEATTTSAVPATTDAPTTTVSPQQIAIHRLAELQATGDRAGLALFVPLTPAYFYYEGVVLLSEFGDPVPPRRGTPVDGGIPHRRWADPRCVRVRRAGPHRDLSRNGVPLSTSVVGLGYQVEAGALTGTVHSVRAFDGDLQVVMLTTNGSDDDSSFYVDNYVQADGRQLPAMPTTSLSNTVRPGGDRFVRLSHRGRHSRRHVVRIARRR